MRILYHFYQLRENASGSLNLLCLDPERKVKCYNGYFVNGYVVHTEEYGQGKKTYNNRVCVKGSTSNEFKVHYYSLFIQCYWYDTIDKEIKIDLYYDLIKINTKAKLHNVDNVFVFAKQCQQTYYTYTTFFRNDRSRVGWLIVVKTKSIFHVQVN
jgi:hypothetical protein